MQSPKEDPKTLAADVPRIGPNWWEEPAKAPRPAFKLEAVGISAISIAAGVVVNRLSIYPKAYYLSGLLFCLLIVRSRLHRLLKGVLCAVALCVAYGVVWLEERPVLAPQEGSDRGPTVSLALRLTVLPPACTVKAVLYDITSGANTALDTGTLEVAGWSNVSWYFAATSSTGSFTVNEVDDTGASLNPYFTTSATSTRGGLGPGTIIGASGTVNALGATLSLPVPKRLRLQSAAVADHSTRIIVSACR